MADFSELVKVIRQIVQETTAANKPSGIYFGTVISINPIKIQISPQQILTAEFIIIGQHIKGYTRVHATPNEQWNNLRKNDELLLLREQGGQRYAVLDWTKMTGGAG